MLGGLDLSLTGTGVCVIDTEARTLTASRHGTKAQPRVPAPGLRKARKPRMMVPVWSRAARVSGLATVILDAIPVTVTFVAVESPSYMSTGGSAHERGGLYWTVLGELYKRGTHLVEVSPKSLKLYATGDAEADKLSVVDATVERYGVSYRDDNMIDATVLAAMASRFAGFPMEPDLPENNLRAMDGVLWPTPEDDDDDE